MERLTNNIFVIVVKLNIILGQLSLNQFVEVGVSKMNLNVLLESPFPNECCTLLLRRSWI